MLSKPHSSLALSPRFSLSFSPFPVRENRKKESIQAQTPGLSTRSLSQRQKMKRSGLLAAYVAAASATAVSVSSPSSSSSLQISHQDGMVQRNHENSSSASSSSTDKFAPRFDGLRFIETLVTAHR